MRKRLFLTFEKRKGKARKTTTKGERKIEGSSSAGEELSRLRKKEVRIGKGEKKEKNIVPLIREKGWGEGLRGRLHGWGKKRPRLSSSQEARLKGRGNSVLFGEKFFF